MGSPAARLEEIQLRLQQLKEQREREQAAFDTIAAEQPDLSPQAIVALAQKCAGETAPQTITVDGATVSVGEKVRVKDDLALLHRADRGHFSVDVLKSVYLGERGEVLRVMESFQGKPAAELRFADGVTKVFFAECLDVAPVAAAAASVDGVPTSIARSKAGRATSLEGRSGAPSTKSGASGGLPPAASLPGWAQLSMPHRKPAAAPSHDLTTAPSLPPPPPTVLAVRKAERPWSAVATATTGAASPLPPSTQKVAAPMSAPSASPPAAAQTTTAAAVTATAVTAAHVGAAAKPEEHNGPVVMIRKTAPAKATTTSTKTASVITKEAPPSANSSTAASSFVIPAATTVKRPPLAASPVATASPSPPPPQAAVAATETEDLGAPSPLLSKEVLLAAVASPNDGEGDGVLDLRPAAEPMQSDEAYAAAAASEAQVEEKEQAKDTVVATLARTATTPPPRRLLSTSTAATASSSNSGTRFCWVCGLLKPDDELCDPVRVAFQSQCTAMFSIFAVLTRKLQWDKKQRTASRLFTDRGVELKTASAVQDGMRLVATCDCIYQPEMHPTAFHAVADVSPSAAAQRRLPAATAAATMAPGPSPTKAGRLSDPATPPSARVAAKSSPKKSAADVPAAKRTALPAAAAAAATVPTRTGVAAAGSSPAASVKLRHIRVYENGQYDDNIYRTVTVRATHKSLAALKTTVTRELQWRDGKKVDLLFDASGAEIEDLNRICDGDVVVASAGDKFVIPYPNTVMHQEAMKLSERIDPPRE